MYKRLFAVLAALLTLTFALVACGNADSSKADSSKASSPKASSTNSGATCAYTKDGSPAARKVSLPSSEAPRSGTVQSTITLNSGALPVTLDAKATPCTVNSFVSLAEQGYFDNTVCHRLVTQGIYVLQCGDPTASGTGGPGYTIPDELTGHETYDAGTLAMANTGAPNSGGSQFFIVYKASQLPPSYAVFGHISKSGLAVVKAIAAKGTANGSPDGPPKSPVTITSVK